MPPIVFGTDGWRARIADEFTYDAVRRCAEGVARYVVDTGTTARGVVVGYDRRFSSEFFAQAAAEVLLAHDIPVLFAREALPTQMVSYEVVERRAACGIVITASHNPWTDNGFKVKSDTGAAAGPQILAVLEATIRDRAGDQPPRHPFADGVAGGRVEYIDSFDGYQRYVERSLDLDRLRQVDMRVLVEPMWGAGAGWISRLLAGGRIRVNEIHQERNPYFGGVNPEPIRPNVDEALGMLAGGGYDMGLLLDGDLERLLPGAGNLATAVDDHLRRADGAQFQGAAIGALALHELGSISERRVDWIMNPNLTDLPPQVLMAQSTSASFTVAVPGWAWR